jgi:RNA polymerase sigma factor (sigma-70 family)
MVTLVLSTAAARTVRDSAQPPTLAPVRGLDSMEALLAFARRILARTSLSAADRDDVVQDVALVLVRRWPSYERERGDPRAWLRGIVAVELRASARRRGRVLGDLVSELPEVPVESDVEPTVVTQEILAAMPAAERRVLQLSAAGYTFREVAAREGISASTALARHGRGLALARRTEVKRPPLEATTSASARTKTSTAARSKPEREPL